jgi:hypothetical protein
MVYDGPSVSDDCQMVYDGVGWFYTGKGCQMVKMVQMVYDGRSVSDGCQMVYDGPSVSDDCQMVYDGVGWLYREGLSNGEYGADGV